MDEIESKQDDLDDAIGIATLALLSLVFWAGVAAIIYFVAH